MQPIVNKKITLIVFITIVFLVHSIANKTAILDDRNVKSERDSVLSSDLSLEMCLIVKDSVKTIVFELFESVSGKERIPVKADVVFYVPRMFSRLKIAEGTSGDDGKGEVEFPEGVQGDSVGNLTVIGKVEENEMHGNAENSQTIRWGVPTNYHVTKFHRALWTTIAPKWMIVTLTILLLGVWGHYMFVIYTLCKIKKASN